MAVLAALYAVAWLAPAVGLAYRDGVFLAAAVNHQLGEGLFPVALMPFALLSRQPQWLKLTPLACTILWLILTRRLLTRMGASPECATFLVVITAASPTVIYLATGLFAEPLFALLITVALLSLLDDKPLQAGLCAGLATVTLTAGIALIVAILITLVATRRLRDATVFTCAAMAPTAPWLGWQLSHGGVPAAALHLSELAMLTGNNAMLIAASPFTLLSGYPSLYPGLLTAVALLIVLVRRRYFVPDLFIGFYCLILIWRTESPLHAFAPVLPLFLWMLWRVARSGRFALVTRATAILMIAPALWFGASRVATVPRLGAVTSENGTPDNWREMEKLFAFIRTSTPADARLLADLDPVFFLNTGRITLRCFAPDGYREYYAPPGALVNPDGLRAAIARGGVNYVVLTPDLDLPESKSFHMAAAAMERGGVLEPVSVPGVAGGYRLLRVVK